MATEEERFEKQCGTRLMIPTLVNNKQAESSLLYGRTTTNPQGPLQPLWCKHLTLSYPFRFPGSGKSRAAK